MAEHFHGVILEILAQAEEPGKDRGMYGKQQNHPCRKASVHMQSLLKVCQINICGRKQRYALFCD